MIVVFFCVCGLAIGGAFDLVWWCADTLIGSRTITVDKSMAVIGLGAVGTAVFVGAMMAIDELRGR